MSVILPAVMVSNSAFFFCTNYTASISCIQALVIFFPQKPCVTWFHFVGMYKFSKLLQNVSGPNPVIRW